LLALLNTNKRRDDTEDKEQLEYKAILEKLLKEADNKKCADCGSAAPRWASANLGVFLCIKCSGIHRSMGCHISFIRSVSLDKWKAEEIALMSSVGNALAAQVWEAKLPAEYKRPSPNDGISLEKFIRDKYEHKRYYKSPTDKQKTEPSPQIRSSNNVTALRTTSLPQSRPSTPLRSENRAPQETLLVDPFLSISSPSQSIQKPQPVSVTPSPISNQIQQPQQPTTQPSSTVDVNLFKKSNIMSMFDVQSEQQKQQQLLSQQLYYTPQLYYTTSGGLVPVMYSTQIPAGQVYQNSYGISYPQFSQPSQ